MDYVYLIVVSVMLLLVHLQLRPVFVNDRFNRRLWLLVMVIILAFNVFVAYDVHAEAQARIPDWTGWNR